MKRTTKEQPVFFTEKDIPNGDNPSQRFQVGYALSPGRKTNSNQEFVMEDFILLEGRFRQRDNEDLFGVFDGHDGKDAAEFTTRHFGNILRECLEESEASSTLDLNVIEQLDVTPKEINDDQKRIVFSIHKTFQVVTQNLKEELKDAYGGTTALLALFTENDLYIANVGDSRAVFLKKNGEAERVSTDHRPVEAEKERIEKSGGKVISISVPRVEGMLSVSRALGDFDLVDKGVIWHPHIRVIQDFEEKGDFLILASDGLWDLVSDEEAVSVLQKLLKKNSKEKTQENNEDFFSFEEEDDEEEEEDKVGGQSIERREILNQACRKLTEESFSKFAIDNISVIVIDFAKRKK